ncbi:hypothetical protein JCM9492_11350 [Aquifex pyrophilus]
MAKVVGVSPTAIYYILQNKRYASLEKAIEIELASNGKYKVEDLVRPEVAKALRKYLALRCPMVKKSARDKRGESVKEERDITMEVKK